MALPNKWENACRLCSEQKNEMLSIFGNEGLQRKVVHKLRACLPVLVYKTDPLPKQICQFCAARLDDAYEFREYCLNVYRAMHRKLLDCKDTESVQIFFDAMKNSPDPCQKLGVRNWDAFAQAQLWGEKGRAPPPLVPLPSSLRAESPMPLEKPLEHRISGSMETLPELPCEVEIKEVPTEQILGTDISLYNSQTVKNTGNEWYKMNTALEDITVLRKSASEKKQIKSDVLAKGEEKRTSILEQVLTGNLTVNDRKDVQTKPKLTSNWWCSPCNNYYKTKESLVKHMELYCPRRYVCKKCSMSFETIEQLARHEAMDHLKVAVNCDISVNDCHQCDRQFVSLEMLKQHRLRDHVAKSLEIGSDSWCSLCNRSFLSLETYRNHMQLHSIGKSINSKVEPLVETIMTRNSKTEDTLNEFKKDHTSENPKSLTCPTCGKVCTQQSALSNHMRTHEPKKHKCDICGRFFGLFIRLAAHKMSEHSQSDLMSPAMTSVEQEEALNAEKEAREATEVRNRTAKNRSYSEISMLKREKISNHGEPPTKRSMPSTGVSHKNVARCGICLQWFSDHTTMLTHLQTHSDSYTCKSFTCHTCKKSFKEKWQLLRHKMSHKHNEILPLHTCKICSDTFTDKAAYRTHQKTHTAEKSFIYHCSKCNKVFSKEVSLLTHQCTVKPVCGNADLPRKPTQKSSTTVNNKKYRCSKCNMSFSSSHAKSSHMKTHSQDDTPIVEEIQVVNGELDAPMPKLKPEMSVDSLSPIEPKVEINEESVPPLVKRTLIRAAGRYRCGVCQSPFVLRELAVAHLRSAHPAMPYQCPYCKKRFTMQYTFTHHIKTEHPGEPEN